MNTLKAAKILKHCIDNLGYAFYNGELTTDRQCYRQYLRSGKIEHLDGWRYTCDRKVQYNNLLSTYIKKGLINEQLAKVALGLHFPNDRHTKAYNKAVKVLLNKKLLSVVNLEDGLLLTDNLHGSQFYYSFKSCKLSKIFKGSVRKIK